MHGAKNGERQNCLHAASIMSRARTFQSAATVENTTLMNIYSPVFQLDVAADWKVRAPLGQKPHSSRVESQLSSSRSDMKTILVAGVGNVLCGDDAFGVEVARVLSHRPLPPEVTVANFGMRSYDLAFAILEGYDATILVDA